VSLTSLFKGGSAQFVGHATSRNYRKYPTFCPIRTLRRCDRPND
jgi:hypothetical protein